MNQPSIHRTEGEARQGVTGHNVRHVLWLSRALAIVLLGAVFLLIGNSG